ncbi:5'-3' exonuclease H3TH domain-containing protein [Candidatus Phytoplasma solani]|uniref:5'-3' exonuclease n=2 Tax=Candidatus Phytoplasma solani TaxID=69896 RepID=A0A421NV26_9MOLU|nr:5'-3' exonuclease H3TH domain-containing protein [Candidatus Phytoplasma solani]RMI87881.1 DNA polymerase I [Candidatus Phytoplasma solani]CCP88192.1 DNA polymerase [Candidatus Phytoplasma solani]
MKHLVLVDGNSLLFRAYHATANKEKPLLQNKKGVYTNALLAFIKMFEHILQQTKEYILVAFDTHHLTKRHQIYDDYKKGRPITPSELISQIPLIKQYLTLIGVKHHYQPEYEADDIIGTLAKKASKKNKKVFIYSSDQDLLQLVDANITVCLIKKGLKEIKCFDPQTLLEEYGLKEYQMIDYKALIGDPSDNIKGVVGIGPKTAQKLLQTYDNLNNLLICLDQIKPRLKEQIKNSEKDLKLSKILTTIEVEVPLPFEFNQTQMQACSYQKIKAFYEEMDFRRLKITKHAYFEKEVQGSKVVQNNKTNEYKQQTKNNFVYQTIKTNDDLNKIIKQIKHDQIWTCYFEFENNNTYIKTRSSLIGIGFAGRNQNDNFFIETNIALNNKLFENYLKDPLYQKNVFNSQKTQLFLKQQGKAIAGINFDLLSASYLLFPLESLEFIHILNKIDLLNNSQLTNLLEQIDNLEKSLSLKAFLLSQTKKNIINQLKLQKQLFLFQEIELPLASVLAQLEYEISLESYKEKTTHFTPKDILLSQKHYLLDPTLTKFLTNNNNSHLTAFPIITLKTLATLGNIHPIKDFFKFGNQNTQDQEKLTFFKVKVVQKNEKDKIDIDQKTIDPHQNIISQIAQELNIDFVSAKTLIDQYFTINSEILDYTNKLLTEFKQNQHLETLLKRKVFVDLTQIAENKNNHLFILWFFLQENILDLQKIAILQLFRNLKQNYKDKNLTDLFLNHNLNKKIDLVSQHCNPFLSIKINQLSI